MGGSSSALSMGYAVAALIVLYLVITAVMTLAGCLKKKNTGSKKLKPEDDLS